MSEFLSAVSPQLSIISSGEENPYGHPSPELLERLGGSGSRVLRTDENGAVRVLTDGHTLRLSYFAGCLESGGESVQAQSPNHGKTKQQ